MADGGLTGLLAGLLAVGGNAEAGYCTRDWNAATTIPGWTVTGGSPNVMCYSVAHIRHPAGRGSEAAGRGLISSGPYGDSAMSQTIRLPAAAARRAPARSGSPRRSWAAPPRRAASRSRPARVAVCSTTWP